MNDNLIIKTYWEGPLSVLEILSIKSFIANGHIVFLYTYDKNIKSFHTRMEVKDASEIIPHERRNSVKGISTVFSDLFRYHLLYKTGGWWMDLDSILLKPVITDRPIVMSMCYGEKKGKVLTRLELNNTPIKVPKGHALAAACIKNAESRDFEKLSHGVLSGPLLATESSHLNLDKYIVPPEIYSPLGWGEAPRVTRSGFGFDRITPNTVAVHMFNVMWSNGENSGHPLDKNAKYPEDSMYEWLKRKYL